MGNTWGRKVPLKEVLRKNKREINKAVRELDRERANLEKQEQKLVSDIKKYAKDGQMGPVKIMAKDLVRTRTYITKFIELRSHLNAVALKLQTVKSQEAMARAMKSRHGGRCEQDGQKSTSEAPGSRAARTDIAMPSSRSRVDGVEGA